MHAKDIERHGEASAAWAPPVYQVEFDPEALLDALKSGSQFATGLVRLART